MFKHCASLLSFLGQDPRFCSSSLSIKSLKGDFHQLLPMLALSVVVLIVQLKLIVFIDCLITLATNDRKARQIRSRLKNDNRIGFGGRTNGMKEKGLINTHV